MSHQKQQYEINCPYCDGKVTSETSSEKPTQYSHKAESTVKYECDGCEYTQKHIKLNQTRAGAEKTISTTLKESVPSDGLMICNDDGYVCGCVRYDNKEDLHKYMKKAKNMNRKQHIWTDTEVRMYVDEEGDLHVCDTDSADTTL